jgi:hypothetical protein
MMGFGIDVKDPNDIGDEDDPRIVGHDVTNGNEEGGRKAMETCCRRTRASTWSTPSTNRLPSAPTRR